VRARFPEGPAELGLISSALRMMVVPIFMPDAERGNSGELVGLFNKRPFRRFVLANIIDKVVGQSRFYRRRIPRRLDRTDYLQVVDMEVGNLYLFWGYHSLHGNMPYALGSRCAVWAKSVPAARARKQ
jgi:hypothetical protein